MYLVIRLFINYAIHVNGGVGGYQILLIDTFYIDLRGPSIELLGTLFFVDSDREG